MCKQVYGYPFHEVAISSRTETTNLSSSCSFPVVLLDIERENSIFITDNLLPTSHQQKTSMYPQSQMLTARRRLSILYSHAAYFVIGTVYPTV